MEKIKRFFRELNEKRVYQIVFFVASMCVILSGYVFLRIRITDEISKRYTVVEDKNLVKFVEEVTVENGRLTIYGWCFYVGTASSKDKVRVFLRNINDEEEVIWLEVEDVQRSDVKEYYGGVIDYQESGFKAWTQLKNVDLDTKDYEILIKFSFDEAVKNNKSNMEQKEVTVETKRYICKGVLCDLPFEKSSTFNYEESIELKEVFENGHLIALWEEDDICIYQYKSKVYWIVGKEYQFSEDGMTYIGYQIDTTRSDLLPIERQQNNLKFDNRSFYFEQKEIEITGSPCHRVAVCELPSEYPITCITTGYYIDSDWKQRECFNIDISVLAE